MRKFLLEFQSAVSNSLEVAIGRDADEDGELSLDETALAVGYDCGRWLVRSAANDSVSCETSLHEGWVRRVYEVRSRNVDPAWSLAKVTRLLKEAGDTVGIPLIDHVILSSVPSCGNWRSIT